MMTDKERAQIKAIFQKVEALEAAGLYDIAEREIAIHDTVFSNYTMRDGVIHYCGPVANENGWTP